jgi:hypothetical protein
MVVMAIVVMMVIIVTMVVAVVVFIEVCFTIVMPMMMTILGESTLYGTEDEYSYNKGRDEH